MGTKEAKRYRKLARAAIDMSTKAKVEDVYNKARRALRRQAVLFGVIVALIPANLYVAFILIKEVVK
jgi:hypothetical protein